MSDFFTASCQEPKEAINSGSSFAASVDYGQFADMEGETRR
jgi:hypothetical protein